MKVGASFLNSKNKSKDISKLNLTTIDYIHVDFMDGKFVKQKTLPFRELKKIYKYTSKRLDVHIMAIKPAKLIKKFASLNTEFITIHVELNEDLHKYIKLIHKYGIKAGLAINPETDIDSLKEYLDEIELVLVMSVEPGLGGQEYIPETTEKIKKLKNLLHSLGHGNIYVNVDGGINEETANLIRDDVDILTSGSFIMNSDNFQESIDILKGLVLPQKLDSLSFKSSLGTIGEDVSIDKNDILPQKMTVEDLMKPMDNQEHTKDLGNTMPTNLTYEELVKNMSNNNEE